MPVLVKNIQNRHQISIQKIRQIAQILLDALGYLDSELSILMVDDLQISKLNTSYLKKKGPTNVIAFPMFDGKAPDFYSHIMGDVVISVDTAKHEGSTVNVSTLHRIVELLIHGILHLVGYDHTMSRVEVVRMEKKSKELFSVVRKKIGFF